MKLTQEQEAALDLIMSGRNVFLTGEAGTGKSTIISELQERTDKNCVLLAPTGMAAVNIGGSTIHSFMRFAPILLNESNIEPLRNKSEKSLIRNADIIVIDEISMVRGDLFKAIDFRLRQVMTGRNKKRPFGGKQIVVVGDFYQLPPVVHGEDERKAVIDTAGGIFAFQTSTWVDGQFEYVSLKNIVRQSTDRLFISILNHIRHNELSVCDIADPETGQMMNVRDILNKYTGIARPLSVTPVQLCTTNREADTLNSYTMNQLPEKSRTFTGAAHGTFSDKDFPAPAILELKKGARVMTLTNRRSQASGRMEYVNGDVGEVVDFIDNPSGVTTIVVSLDNGNLVKVTPNEWKNYKYMVTGSDSDKPKIEQKEIGAYVQYPLKLAYAITIHKSQGMSMDAVMIKLGNGCFAHGQLYTALSRCRTLKNLRIDRPIFDRDIIIDPSVVSFYKQVEVATAANQPSAEKEPRIVCIDVPTKYEAAVRELLKRLESEDAKCND